MAQVYLEAEERDLIGKQQVKHLRQEGKVPAIVYGKDIENKPIQVEHENLIKVLHTSAGENVIIELDIKGEEKKKSKGTLNVILKEIQQHPITTDIIHVDFSKISLTEKIEVKVYIKIKGESVGVTKDNGILEVPLRELNIRCLPTDIPEEIDVQVGDLEIGDTIHVRDITPPEGVEILDDPERTIVSIAAPKSEEELEGEEEEFETVEEPEVIGEKEREEAREKKEKEEDEKEPEEVSEE